MSALTRNVSLAWMLTLVLTVGGGCVGEDATQIMLAVRTDFRVPPAANPELDEITIVVSRDPDATATKETAVSLNAATEWPPTLAITPASGSDTAFVRITGMQDDQVVVSQTAYVQFEAQKKRLLTIDLLHSCADLACDAGDTCRAGACDSEDRREETLPPWTGTPPGVLPQNKLCTGMWKTPVEISVTENTDYDDDPSFTADLLEFYFASSRSGGVGAEDIYVAKRETSESAWGNPELVPNVNSDEAEETPQISRDGLRLWFAKVVGANNDKDVFVSTRPTRDGAWSTPVAVHFWDESGSTKWKDRDVAEFDDGKRIVFSSSHMEAGSTGSYDIFLAEQKPGGDITQWTKPIRISQLSVNEADDMGPYPSADGSRIYFQRLPAGTQESDLYVAEKVPMSGEYGEPVRIDELSLGGDFYEQDMQVSDDECFAMFSRQYVENDKNVSNVYVSTRDE